MKSQSDSVHQSFAQSDGVDRLDLLKKSEGNTIFLDASQVLLQPAIH